jgi:hypothetical protein
MAPENEDLADTDDVDMEDAPEHKMMRDVDKMLRAAKKGDWELADACMTADCGMDQERRKAYLNRRDQLGSTIIFFAARHRQLKFVRKLLTQRADVTIQNSKGNTAMHVACEKGHLDVVQLLVEASASIEVRNTARKRCWEVVSERLPNQLELMDAIKRMPADRENKFASSRTFGPELCRDFIDAMDFFNYEKYRLRWKRQERSGRRREKVVFEQLAREAKRQKQAMADVKRKRAGDYDENEDLEKNRLDAEEEANKEAEKDRVALAAIQHSDDEDSDDDPNSGTHSSFTLASHARIIHTFCCYRIITIILTAFQSSLRRDTRAAVRR